MDGTYVLCILYRFWCLLYWYTVKPACVVTSIKGSPALSSHFSRFPWTKLGCKWTCTKGSPDLSRQFLSCPWVTPWDWFDCTFALWSTGNVMFHLAVCVLPLFFQFFRWVVFCDCLTWISSNSLFSTGQFLKERICSQGSNSFLYE